MQPHFASVGERFLVKDSHGLTRIVYGWVSDFGLYSVILAKYQRQLEQIRQANRAKRAAKQIKIEVKTGNDAEITKPG